MKNNIWFVIACVLTFFTGYSMNNMAVSFPKYKVAVVDIQAVMDKSNEIQALKVSQDKQMNELNTLISKAQNEILNEPDRNKAMQLEENYRKQIEEKKNSIDEDYNKKLVQVTTKIRNLISGEAKKTNYNLVLPTGMVITGGEDITQDIIGKLK
ncbi:OmpH family outer membrane protein [bacterium]|nr:OmpH family outer membrane protein [bacterium]